MNDEVLDAAERDANARFDALKREGVAIEENMAKEKQRLDVIHTEMTRCQGEHRAIQNLRKKADPAAPGALPAEQEGHGN